MSGGTRRALEHMRSRLDAVLDKIANAPQLEVKLDEAQADEALVIAIKDLEQAVATVRAAQQNVFDLLAQWDEILTEKDVASQIKDMEAELTLKASWEKDTRVVLDRAFATLERLHYNLDALTTQRHRRQHDREAAARTDSLTGRHTEAIPVTTDEPPRTERTTRSPAVPDILPKLPQQTLPYFDGSKEKWPDFYEVFQSLIGTAPHLTDIHKLNYLRPLLRGDAERLVAGYPNVARSYEEILDVLRKEYGDQRGLRMRLHAELRNLSVRDGSTNAAWNMLREAERITRQLKHMGEDIEHPHVESSIVEKLPPWLMAKVLKKKDKEPTWTTTPLLRYLDKELLNRRAIEEALGSQKQPEPTPATVAVTQAPAYRPRTEMRNQGARNYPPQKEKRKPHCLFCDAEHFPSQCSKFPTPEARRKKLDEMGRCKTCTRVTHPGRDCGRLPACHFCKSYAHPTVTCNLGPGGNGRKPQGRQGGQRPLTQVTATLSNKADNEEEREVFLMTKDITLVNPTEPRKSMSSTTLFDTAAEKTFITEKAVQKLELVESQEEPLQIAAFASEPATVTVKKYEVALKQTDGTLRKIMAYALPRLTSRLKTLKDKDLQQSQPVYTLKEPDLLLGMDNLHYFMNVGRPLPSGLRALRTTLGEIPYGLTNSRELKDSAATIAVVTSPEQEDKELLKRLYSLEGIGIVDDPNAHDDAVAYEMFLNTHKRGPDGRFEVKWPWKKENPDLPEGYGAALAMLHASVNKLKEEPELMQLYDDVIKEQEAQNIVEEVRDELPKGICHYLSHFAVITPSKKRKIRIVFDASHGHKQKRSLNDQLLRGPILSAKLAAVLLRFRTYPTVVICDVSKAFLQIGLQEPDRDCCRFLWLRDITKPVTKDNVKVMRFKRMTFGVISAPSLLSCVIQKLLDDHPSPLAKELAINTYADNLLFHAKSTDEAMKKAMEIKDIFMEAQMPLREFLSNDQAVNKKFADDDDFVLTKFLGVGWDTVHDELTLECKTAFNENQKKKQDGRPLTVRDVMSVTASYYDPLGLVGPVILPARKFFQKIWEQKRDWKATLTTEEEAEWQDIWLQATAEPVKFPRVVLTSDEPWTLHVFGDASQLGYGTACYLTDGRQTHLVFAKTRVCPEKELSIPKLELLAATMAAKIAKFVEENINHAIKKKVLWTDSKVTLSWIHATAPSKKRFVANRVEQIRQGCFDETRYVPTDHNPADIASRGATAQQLEQSTLWKRGPEWLTNETKWPATPPLPSVEEADEELKHRAPIAVLAITSPPYEKVIADERFSSWTKLATTTSLVLRFIKKVVLTKMAGPSNEVLRKLKTVESGSGRWTTTSERRLAEEFLIRQAQQESPPTEYQTRSLDIFKDDENLYRCRGRLGNSELKMEARTPIFLPRKSHAVQLIILAMHERLAHAGTPHTLTELHSEFWIPQGRTAVNSAISSCMECKRRRAKPFELPQFPSLPPERVRRSKPFAHTAVDCCGPIQVQSAEGPKKIWVTLFTCLSSRAIHMEVVSALSAAAFLNALRRFVARRGRPESMLSDNATNFRMVAKVIDTAWNPPEDKEVLSFLAQEKISWKWIPQHAAFQGGVYERQIRMVKEAMKGAIGKRVLAIDDFETTIVEIEGILNSRPITYTYGAEGGRALRPVDLLTPNLSSGAPFLPDSNSDDSDTDDLDYTLTSRGQLLNLWSKLSDLARRFWDRWTAEYLPSLRERFQRDHVQPRSRARRAPRIGEVVIVADEQMKRGQWRLATIEKLSPSADGAVRSATIRMANGRFTQRPLCQLCPLEIDDTSKEKEATDRQGEMDTNDDANEAPTVQQDEPRYNLRPRKGLVSKAAVYAVLLLAMLMPAAAMHCTNPPRPSDFANSNARAELQLLFVGACRHTGVIIYSHPQAGFCVDTKDCGDNVVQKTPEGTLCVSAALAPCAPHEATASSSKSNPKAVTLFERLRPHDVCSFSRSPECAEAVSNQTFPAVELWDGTTYIIEQLHVHTEVARYEVCFGDGTRIGGTEEYCNINACVESPTKFCHLDQYEVFMVQNGDEKVAIKTWKDQVVSFHGHKKKDASASPAPLTLGPPGGDSVESTNKTEATSQHHDGAVEAKKCEGWTTKLVWKCWTWEQKALFASIPVALVACLLCLVNQILKTIYKIGRVICCPLRALRWIATRSCERKAKKRWIPKKVAFYGTLATLLVKEAVACADLLPMQTSSHICNEKGQCVVSATFSFNSPILNQTTCLAIQDREGTTSGFLELTLEGLEAVCQRRTLFYTRDYTIEVASVRRCPDSGSCRADKCSTLQPQEHIPEMGIAEKFPGTNRCVDGASGWSNACFSFEPGCLFYRPHARPRSELILQVFTCSWTFQMSVKGRMKVAKEEEFRLRLRPGLIAKHDKVRLQLEGVQMPILPSAPSRFITDGRRTALINEDDYEAIRTLRCPSPKAAKDLTCTLHEDSCSCQPTGDHASCLCADGTQAAKLLEEASFPQSLGPHRLQENVDGDLITDIDAAAQTLRLELRNLTLRAARVDEASCSVTAELRKDALHYECTTHGGQAIGVLVCPGVPDTPLLCDSAKRTRITTLPRRTTGGNITCQLNCPSSRTTTVIHAIQEEASGPLPEGVRKALQVIPVMTETLLGFPNVDKILYSLLMLTSLLLVLFLWGGVCRRCRHCSRKIILREG